MEEELTCTCPHCGKSITFDESGEPVAAIELAPAERRGVRGIVVEEAVPNWQHGRYHSNSQAEKTYLKYSSAQPLTAPAPIDDAAPIDAEDLTAISQANQADLKRRNLTN